MGSGTAGSLIDMLPPEAQNVLGIGALVVVVLGLVLWGAGVKIARLAVAVLVGAAGAILGAWLAPAIFGLGALTGALAGFGVGVLTGALAFRLLQGLTLAACLGLAVAGAYYHWHVQAADETPRIAAEAAPKPDAVPAPDLLIKGPLSGATTAAAAKAAITDTTTLAQRLVERWNAIPSRDQNHMLIAGIGTAAAVLLLAFGFPRHTTWVVTAALGTLMLMVGADALTHVYAPQFPYPAGRPWRYGLASGLTLLGMLIQWRCFWPVNRRTKTRPAADKAPEKKER